MKQLEIDILESTLDIVEEDVDYIVVQRILDKRNDI